MDPDVRSQMGGGKGRKPSGNVLLNKRESFVGEDNEWIEEGAPGDLVIGDRIVEMARSDGIFCEDQGVDLRIPNGESPVADEIGETIPSPLLVGRGDDGYIRRINRRNICQPAD